VDDQRFHLTLFSGGRPVAHGWWAGRATADRKFTTWVGEFGAVEAPRVVLVDEDEQRVLASWPDA
jgi:hypothetical protein